MGGAMMYNTDLVIIIYLLLAATIVMIFVNVGSDIGGVGVLLVLFGLIMGWPFSAIGAVMLIANAWQKRRKIS